MKFRILLLSILITSIVAVPAMLRAQTTNNVLLQQIAQLLLQVQFLQTQLAVIEGGTVGPVIGTPNVVQIPTTTHSCVAITQTLQRGSRGEEVEKLQQYLTKTGHYTYGEVTGYYGAATEAAVQRFQASRGVVSSGSSETTGYGVVGPATRRALGANCTGAEFNDAVARNLVVTPEVGPLPLQVTATFSLNGSSCSSFSLDWGDGTKPLTFDAGNTISCTKDIAHKRATHTYTVPGNHRVTFRAGRGALSQARVVSQTYVSVGDTAPTGFSIRPTSGSAPLTTSITFPVFGSSCTSYEADWGDGNVDRHEASTYDACTQDSGTQSLTHTYLSADTYTVRFKTGRAPIAQLSINEQWNVVVRDDINPGSAVEIKPTAGTAPLTVMVDMFGFGESCTSYSLDWGDFSSVQEFEAASSSCGTDSFQKTFTHTYIAPGNYVVKTKIGQGSLSDLSVSAQTVLVGGAGSGAVRTNCSYPSTPVCGEILTSCSAGYTCSQVFQTFSNRCALEDAGAIFAYSGVCN